MVKKKAFLFFPKACGCLITDVPYLLMFKLTFYDQKVSPKNHTVISSRKYNFSSVATSVSAGLRTTLLYIQRAKLHQRPFPRCFDPPLPSVKMRIVVFLHTRLLGDLNVPPDKGFVGKN